MAERMKPRRIAVGLMLAILLLSGCESAPPDGATATPPAQAVSTPAATATVPATPTPANTPPFRTPTPPANPGTVIKDDGSFLVLSHPFFFWTLKLPRDWLITYDRGFELFANNSQQTAFVRLFSEVWSSVDKRLPTARAYV